MKKNIITGLGVFFVFVVSIEITVLTHAFGVGHSISMRTFGRKAGSSIEMVTVITHTFCIMLCILMRAAIYKLLLPALV